MVTTDTELSSNMATFLFPDLFVLSPRCCCKGSLQSLAAAAIGAAVNQSQYTQKLNKRDLKDACESTKLYKCRPVAACNELWGSKWQILRPWHQTHSSFSFFSTWHYWLQRSAMMLTCEISHSCTCLLQNPDNSRRVDWNMKSKVFCALKTMETFR